MLKRGQMRPLTYINSHAASSKARTAPATLSGSSSDSWDCLMKTLCLALLAAAFLAACEREGPLERAGEKVDRAIERTGDKIENATDRK